MIPAALGCAIRESNASDIRAKVVVEGANSPVTNIADQLLEKRGIVVLPDILANAGGVIVSYFEWVQNLQQMSWELETVRERMQKKLNVACDAVFALVSDQNITYREASYQIATRRLKSALFTIGF